MIDNITIETATSCNAKCIICPNNSNPRPYHLMPLDEFEGVLRFFPSLKIMALCGMYEPLMDPRLSKIFDIIENLHPKTEVVIFTNGVLLTIPKAKMLLSHSSFKHLVVSIHGYSQEVYQRVMGLNRDVVYKNVLNFMGLLDGDTPDVNVSFVRVRQNIEELNLFREFWEDKVHQVSDFEIMNWNGAIPISEFLIEEPKHVRACPMFEKPLVIDAFGNIVKCCYDFSWNYGHVLRGGYQKWLEKKPISETFPMEHCKPCYGWRHY